MSENNATVTTQEPTAETQGRTFNQEELNAIVGKRLADEKAKYADYDALKEKAAKFDAAEEAQKTELQKAVERANSLESELTAMKKAEEIRTAREKVATETGVPAALLTGETEEDCKAQAEAIKAYATPNGYPKVKDAGESQKPTGSVKQQFAEALSGILA